MPHSPGKWSACWAKLDVDIALRNQHTHDKFLSVGILTGNDIYDPADALLDLSTQPHAHQVLEEFLKEEMQWLVDEQVARGRAVSTRQARKPTSLFR